MRNRPPQKAVRRNQLEQRLGHHDAEIGQKMAAVLHVFHGRYVAPLEERIAYLEKWWWQRLWIRLSAAARRYIKPLPAPEPEVAEPEDDGPDEAA